MAKQEATLKNLEMIYEAMNNGDLEQALQKQNRVRIENSANAFIKHFDEHEMVTPEQVEKAKLIVKIASMVYHNPAIVAELNKGRAMELPQTVIEDEPWERIVEILNVVAPGQTPVGAPEFKFEEAPKEEEVKAEPVKKKYNPFVDKDLPPVEKTENAATIVEENVPKKGVEIKIDKKNSNNTVHEFPRLKGNIEKAYFIRKSPDLPRKAVVLETVFKKWFDALGKAYTDTLKIGGSLKDDGISLILSIEGEVGDTKLIKAAITRGDDGLGTDVTEFLADYEFKPLKHKLNRIGLKTEAVMPKSAMITLASQGYEYANTRMAASGALSNHDTKGIAAREHIVLIPLECECEGMNREHEILAMNEHYTKSIKFHHSTFEGNLEELLIEAENLIHEVTKLRGGLDYDIDGIVFELMDTKEREILGRDETSQTNNYQIAYKFPAKQAISTPTGMEFSVGFTGVVTPKCFYEEVIFNNTSQTNSSLHSKSKFDLLNIKPGDELIIEYRGEVICDVTKDPTSPVNAANTNEPYKFPTNCPVCNSVLVPSDSGKQMYCLNDECPAKCGRTLLNFVSKLGVDEWGEQRINTLYEAGVISKLSDILTISDIEIIKLGESTMGPAIAEKMCANIETLRNKPTFDYNIYGALGIRGVGRTQAKKIFAKYTKHELDSMIAENETKAIAKLAKINSIGEKLASNFIYFISDNAREINEIVALMTMEESKGKETSKGSVVFTGFIDETLAAQIEERGYEFKKNLTKDTALLIYKEPNNKPDGKYMTALSNNTPMVQLSEFNIELIDVYIRENK